jgi:hypothetical protein
LLLIHLPPFHRTIEQLVDEARAICPLAEPAIDGMGVAVFMASDRCLEHGSR